MSEPRSYPEDKGPFDASAAAAAENGDKVFTADDPATHDDPAAPDAVQYGGAHRDGSGADDPAAPAVDDDGAGPELLDAQINTDPDMSVVDDED